MFQRELLESFRFAIRGFVFVFKNERNMRLHCVIATLVIILAACMKVSSIEWFFLLFAAAFVFVTEIINTAFELLLDYINGTKFHSTVKMLKDIAAAGVLVASINAAVIGCIVFYPLLHN